METKDYFLHESSYVDEPCVIGPGIKIWHFSHVMKNSRIGAGCNIGQNVVISPDVVIGSNVKIQNNVSVYTGCILEDQRARDSGNRADCADRFRRGAEGSLFFPRSVYHAARRNRMGGDVRE